jgi:hypothetical protein
VRAEWAQGRASRRCVCDECDEERAARRRVVAREAGELAIESLEAQAHAERLLVLDEERVARGDVGRVEGLTDLEARRHRAGPSRGSCRT